MENEQNRPQAPQNPAVRLVGPSLRSYGLRLAALCGITGACLMGGVLALRVATARI